MNDSNIGDRTLSEFFDPRLATVYDLLNPFELETIQFFQNEPSVTSAEIIADLGCGTGILTCALAESGHQMIGVEPADAMLEVARRRSYSDKVQWIKGEASQLGVARADLVIMTSHVAQFLLTDAQWHSALASIHRALRPGGQLIFDSKNPSSKPWESWTREGSSRTVAGPSDETIEMWYQLSGIQGNRARYEIHYRFGDTGEELISKNELIYRSQADLTRSLADAGFKVDHVYGEWDRSAVSTANPELIFVAMRV